MAYVWHLRDIKEDGFPRCRVSGPYTLGKTDVSYHRRPCRRCIYERGIEFCFPAHRIIGTCAVVSEFDAYKRIIPRRAAAYHSALSKQERRSRGDGSQSRYLKRPMGFVFCNLVENAKITLT